MSQAFLTRKIVDLSTHTVTRHGTQTHQAPTNIFENIHQSLTSAFDQLSRIAYYPASRHTLNIQGPEVIYYDLALGSQLVEKWHETDGSDVNLFNKKQRLYEAIGNIFGIEQFSIV